MASVAVVQLLSHLWLCDPMECSMPSFPVLHHLLEVAQTYFHWVGDARYMIHARYIASVHGYDFSLLQRAKFYVAGASVLLSFSKYFMTETQVPTQHWYLEIQSIIGAPLLKKLHVGPDNQWSPGPTSLSRPPHWSFPWLVKVKVTQSVWVFATPRTAVCQASLSFTISWSLLKLMSIESVIPSNHFILCRPLLLLPSIFPSIRVFSNDLALCIRWPKYESFSVSISPSNEYSRLISFRIGRLDLFAVQRTLQSLV